MNTFLQLIDLSLPLDYSQLVQAFFKFCIFEKFPISGKFIIPSVVAYCDEEILVGNPALTSDTDISNILYGFFKELF